MNFTSFNHVELPRFQKRALMSTKKYSEEEKRDGQQNV